MPPLRLAPSLRRVLHPKARPDFSPHLRHPPKPPHLTRSSSSTPTFPSRAGPLKTSSFEPRYPPPNTPVVRETAVQSIKLDLEYYGIPHWGWAIFRTAYGTPELDSAWEKLKARILSQSAAEMARSDVPGEVVRGLKWDFVEDEKALQNKSRYDLRLVFMEWVAKQPKIDAPHGPPSRYLHFVQVDGEVLGSGDGEGGEPGFVKLVRCDERMDLVWEWETEEERGGWEVEDGDEGWMRVSVDTLNAEFYSCLGDWGEGWYAFYERPPGVVVY
ncbi:hypothetical protein QBC34DRAFT_437300 [Podospora aff. communis PSN243]|uniref:Uncharacterized protein n=1 Tax=Podospora aff. communis PSN243 TaxID=3040156 RepID=A0AAV9GPY3_9PEZI|nr:hypothetical protein QBC34DRAFT_437300 [Podospora aff. communis PSN243]